MLFRFGAINYDGAKRNTFLDIPLGPERGLYAEDTAKAIDAEVRRIMTEAHNEARRILRNKREMLETVTRQLLEQEIMEGDQLRQLLQAPPATDQDAPERTPLPPNVH